MIFQKNIQRILTLCLYSLVFIGSFYKPLDPDLGWELKYGQYFIQNHLVLKTNIFSSLMPNFYWVNHSWLADTVLFLIFNSFGFFGLTVAGAFVITVMFYIFAKAANLSLIQQIILLPPLLYLESALNIGSLRPQLISLFLFSILIYLLTLYERGSKKIIFLIIPLLTLWANMHGEFILGLGVLFLWIILSGIKLFLFDHTQKNDYAIKKIFLLFSVTVLSTSSILINPYGVGVYTETVRHFFNPNLQYIIEWHPFPLLSQDWWNLIVVGLLLIWSFFTLKSANKLKDQFILISISALFFLLSLFSRRYIWPFYYLTLPFLAVILNQFSSTINKYALQISAGILIVLSIVVASSKNPMSQFTSMTWDSYCKSRMCSKTAAQFLIDNHLNDNPHLLTLYDLGGWLIWNYPQIKPTIDGRMTLWQNEQGNSPFSEYFALEQTMKDIDRSDYTLVFGPVRKPIIKRLLDLANEGKWRLIYYDLQNDPDVAIFEKVQFSANGPAQPIGPIKP